MRFLGETARPVAAAGYCGNVTSVLYLLTGVASCPFQAATTLR
ncbi:MAG: hypothetical protein ACLQNG_03830 [Acidimicrobiales bacterium]